MICILNFTYYLFINSWYACFQIQRKKGLQYCKWVISNCNLQKNFRLFLLHYFLYRYLTVNTIYKNSVELHTTTLITMTKASHYAVFYKAATCNSNFFSGWWWWWTGCIEVVVVGGAIHSFTLFSFCVLTVVCSLVVDSDNPVEALDNNTKREGAQQQR